MATKATLITDLDDSTSILVTAEQVIETIDLDRYPIAIIELIASFLATLKLSPAESKEVLLRAIRRCLKALQPALQLQQNPELLPTLLSMLSDPALSVRLQALSTLLEYCCTANSETIDAQLNLIYQALSSALGLVKTNSSFAPPSHQILQLVSTCLQTLDIIFLKASHIPPDVTSSVVKILENWIYHRPGLGGSMTPLAGRSRSTSAASLSFGVMGAFSPASPVEKTRSVTPGSKSSARSQSSGSEGENGISEKRCTTAGVRCDALACLRSLASKNPKALFTHWNLFLADSPYMRSRSTLMNLIESDPAQEVRLRACAALEAMLVGSASYLAIAEDKPTKASFTSLSSKLGEITSELHLKLASLLLSASIGNASTDLILGLLGIAKNLGRNSPYNRLTRALADPLVRAILPCTRNNNDSIAISATASLTEIASNVYGNPAPKQILDLKAIGAVCNDLLHNSNSALLKQEVWVLLACVVSNDGEFDITLSLTTLQLDSLTSDISIKESQIPYFVALLRQNSSIDLRQYSDTLLEILHSALTSQRGDLRILACALISHSRIDEVLNGCELDLIEEGLRLTEDEDGPVRAAACRALGLLVKSPSFDSESAVLDTIMERLRLHTAEDDLARASASWSFANCCDIKVASSSSLINSSTMMESAISLASSHNGERIQTNGLRALGSLARISTTSTINPATIALIVQTLIEGLTKGSSAKIQWNAATAIGNSLSSPLFHVQNQTQSQTQSQSLNPLPSNQSLLQTLLQTLADPQMSNYKIRIQACKSLRVLRTSQAYGELFDSVRRSVEEARRVVREEEEGVGLKERDHWVQLVQELELCSEHFNKLAADKCEEWKDQ